MKWKKAFQNNKINFGKAKVMASGSKGEKPNSKVNKCAKCGKKVMTNLVLWSICSDWYIRCRVCKNQRSGFKSGEGVYFLNIN